MLPGYNGGNRTFCWSTTKGHGSNEARRLLHRAHARAVVGTLQHARSSIGDRRCHFPTTPFRRGDSRGSRSWRSGTTGVRRRTRRPRRATTRRSARSRRMQNQFTVRGDQDLAKFGRVFFRYTNTGYENAAAGRMHRHRRSGIRAGREELAGISHAGRSGIRVVNQLRIGRVAARSRPARHRVPAVGRGLPQRDGRSFTSIPDAQRECPSIGMTGFSGTGGAVNAYTASNQPMWDISNTDRPGSRAATR